jgi:hypothetical protein
MDTLKRAVYEFGDAASCGESLCLVDAAPNAYAARARQRYSLSPASQRWRGLILHESGMRWRLASDSPLTTGFLLRKAPRSMASASRNVPLHICVRAPMRVALPLLCKPAMQSPFRLPIQDLTSSTSGVYCAIHCIHQKGSMNCGACCGPGGATKFMSYRRNSLLGYMLWLRYALLTGPQWCSMARVCFGHLESPCTRVFSTVGAQRLFREVHSN